MANPEMDVPSEQIGPVEKGHLLDPSVNELDLDPHRSTVHEYGGLPEIGAIYHDKLSGRSATPLNAFQQIQRLQMMNAVVAG